MKQKNIINLFILISFIGILDTGYLISEHFTINNLICNVNDNCNVVLLSKYAIMFGIPMAILGLIYYFTIFINSILFKTSKNTLYKIILLYLPFIGFIFSLWLIYLQLFILHAICMYCMLSALISTTLFVCSILLHTTERRNIL